MRRALNRLAHTVMSGILAIGITGSAAATEVVDPLDRPARVASEPARAVLLDVAVAGERLVAVGERGIVVLSDDRGRTWRQAQGPTSVSLTAVTFPTPLRGWAVGHAGVVLHTEHGGESWVRQLEGAAAAELVFAAAQAAAAAAEPDDPVMQRRLRSARLLVEDGADKPFLDLWVDAAGRGFVVGAYGLMLRTEDGGATWQSWVDRLDNPWGMHIYAIRVVAETIYLAGEQGLFLRSTDGGETFERLETPYEGTYFDVVADAQGNVLLLGLRGNAYWSGDRGETFQRSQVPIPVSFSAVARGDDGTLYFANQAGLLQASHDGGRSLVPLRAPHLPPVASLLALGGDQLLTVGWGGVVPVSLASSEKVGGVR